jgi:hypothetical protein
VDRLSKIFKKGTPVRKVDQNTVQIGSNPLTTLILSDLSTKQVDYIFNLAGYPNERSGETIDTDEQLFVDSELEKVGFLHSNTDVLGGKLIGIAQLNDFTCEIIKSLSHTGVGTFLCEQSNYQTNDYIEELKEFWQKNDLLCQIQCESVMKPDFVIATFEHQYIKDSCHNAYVYRIPILPILLRSDSVVVGPFSNPPQTPCVNCLYMQFNPDFTEENSFYYDGISVSHANRQIATGIVSQLVKSYYFETPHRLLSENGTFINIEDNEIGYGTALIDPNCDCQFFNNLMNDSELDEG